MLVVDIEEAVGLPAAPAAAPAPAAASAPAATPAPAAAPTTEPAFGTETNSAIAVKTLTLAVPQRSSNPWLSLG